MGTKLIDHEQVAHALYNTFEHVCTPHKLTATMAFKSILLLSVLLSVSVVGCLSALLDSSQAIVSSGGRTENHDDQKGHHTEFFQKGHHTDFFQKGRRSIANGMIEGLDIQSKRQAHYTLSNSPCQIHSQTLSWDQFKDIHTQNIKDIATSIEVKFCDGHCQDRIPSHVNRTMSGQLQAVLAHLTGKVPEPCCAPAEFSDVKYPSKDHGFVTLSMAASCHCR